MLKICIVLKKIKNKIKPTIHLLQMETRICFDTYPVAHHVKKKKKTNNKTLNISFKQ